MEFDMQYSVANLSDVKTDNKLFRIDAEYWHPEFIKNSTLVPRSIRIRDFVELEIPNIKSSPINRSFDYLEISGISLNSCEYQTTKVKFGEEPDRARHILQKRDIAVSTVRPNRNAVAFIENNGIIGSSGLSILRARNIESKYLFVFCKTNYFIKCLMRENTASMYPAVSNDDVLDTPIFLGSDHFRSLIAELFRDSLNQNSIAKQRYIQAQTLLLAEVGLTDWQPNHQLTFIKNYSDTEQAERIDAEYYQPKYEEITKAIQNYSGGWDALGNLVSIKKCIEVGSDEYLNQGVPFVRVSNLSPFEITKEKYISYNLYAEIKQHQPIKEEILFSKDATPSIACYLRETPQKMIPSSGVLRLKNKSDKINNEYLTLVLNSLPTKEQMNRDVAGSVILHWRPDQVKETAIPILSEEKQTQIQQKITESFAMKKQSKHLLECAKQTVEIAIEQDEKTATAWLENEAKRN